MAVIKKKKMFKFMLKTCESPIFLVLSISRYNKKAI